METKEKILFQALKLFNQFGTKDISTNHIAKATGISPGNLYYHFRNKEEIIRFLYQKMREEIGFEDLALPETLCDMMAYCKYVATVWWRYRFLKKELVILMQKDPLLQREVQQDTKMQYEKLLQLMEHLMEKGCIVPLTEEMKHHLANTIALYSNFWILFLQTFGEDVSQTMALDVSKEVSKALLPYLSDKAVKELNKCEGV
ncbi:TetR/AcrR family transcriptional regulator [Nitratiruptor sp. SB155-2]|uniref:TetR/AcrR family transcriptional regulator n=1 Tax=Nitratiruptor sp. (strain SB155-2) TaxID=387092 RepID=UPI0001587044|nr:TetR/AcrR family transcriptional regulator [Nitratiruptor sp. SB155-2]BAF70844.1 transcriptional regulator, TetR family [Nitratiruptor sp. SB155-2]